LNYQLVKDEVITFSAGLVKVRVLNTARELINNMFAFKVDIEATIDIKLLDERIKEIRNDSRLKEQLNSERERVKQLEARIAKLQSLGNNATKQEIKKITDELTASEWFEKGCNTNDPVLMIDCYSRAIEVDPQYDQAYFSRAFMYQTLNKYDMAIQDWTKLVGRWEYPNRATALSFRADCYFAIGKYEAAIQDYNKAIELKPQSAYTYYNGLGDAYRQLKKYDVALQNYKKAIELEPQSSNAYYRRGFVYCDLEKYELAIQDYTSAIEFENINIDTLKSGDSSFEFQRGFYKILSEYYYQRGHSNHLAENYKAAISDFNKTIELLPFYSDEDAGYFDKPDREVHSYFRRGLAFGKLNENQKAIHDFNKAIELNPKYDNAYFGRGLVYRNLGKNDLANQDLNKYLKMIGNKYGNAEQVRQWIRDLGYTPQY
jgi:tetratricopeptide (TPR) repeat protein